MTNTKGGEVRLPVMSAILIGLIGCAVVVHVSASDIKRKPQVKIISASLQVITASVNVRDFGATGDGVTDDSAAIEAAQDFLPPTGGTIYFPNGIYAVTRSIVIKRPNITFQGVDMWLSRLKRLTNAAPLAQSSAQYAGIQNVSFADLGFWDYQNPKIDSAPTLLLDGAVIQGNVRISRCRFWKSNGYGIQLNDMSNVVIEDSLFHASGNALGGGIIMYKNTHDVTIRRNRFLYLQNGIVVTSGGGIYRPNSIIVSDNYLDLGWQYVKEKFVGQGSSVSYTANGLTDTAAHFSNLTSAIRDVRHNVRVMPLRQAGRGKFAGTTILDPLARFVTKRVRRGDVVRAGGNFAVVASVESETSLTVEEWLSDTTRGQTISPPDDTSYNVYGLYMGAVWNQSDVPAYTSQSITSIWGWWDLDGNRVTPPNGTRYEVLVRRPNYAIHAEPGTSNITIQNNIVKRSWSDQVSIHTYPGIVATGYEARIVGNQIEDGEDFGVTITGSNIYVANNTIRRQGGGGIFVGGTNHTLDSNSVYDSQAVNDSPVGADIIVYNGSRNSLTNNTTQRISTVDRWGILIYAQQTGISDANVLNGNHCRNHTSGDIGLYAVLGGQVTNTSLIDNEGLVITNGATGTSPLPLSIPTRVTLRSSLITVPFGQPIIFTAAINMLEAGAIQPSGGFVQFRDGVKSLGWAALKGGQAKLVTGALTVGSHDITAFYSGTINFASSTSPSRAVTSTHGSTKTYVVRSLEQSKSGETVTFTAIVQSWPQIATAPTGTVQFRINGIAVGTPRTLSQRDGTYIATYSTSIMKAGENIITAIYSGDSNFAASTGANWHVRY